MEEYIGSDEIRKLASAWRSGRRQDVLDRVRGNALACVMLCKCLPASEIEVLSAYMEAEALPTLGDVA